MMYLINIGAVLLGTAALLLIAQGAAWLLTQWRGPLIKVRPLNCRACMTFWLTLVIMLSAWAALRAPGVWLSLDALMAANALTYSFINYFYINSKFKVYE